MTDVAISLILVVVALGVSFKMRLALEKELLVAVIRGLAQMAAVAAVIVAVFDSIGYSGLVLAVMVVAGAWTAARRIKGVPKAVFIAGGAITAASGTALAVLFGIGVFPLQPRWLIPVAGMLIGNTMTAVSVAGARVREEIATRTLEIEARLALGVHARDALKPYTRRSVTTSLIPIIDSTKNVGLIFLPGAFVGMLLGGADPADAARVQLVVLFMLLGAVSIAAMATALMAARMFVGPGDRVVVPETLKI